MFRSHNTTAAPARRIDFNAINAAALPRLPELLARLLPGGRARGAEFEVGSLRGEPGRSLRIRLHGARAWVWCDFATDERGGDIISLAAAVWRMSQGEAARRLAELLSVRVGGR
jgi:putative DNA primase/helicase